MHHIPLQGTSARWAGDNSWVLDLWRLNLEHPLSLDVPSPALASPLRTHTTRRHRHGRDWASRASNAIATPPSRSCGIDQQPSRVVSVSNDNRAALQPQHTEVGWAASRSPRWERRMAPKGSLQIQTRHRANADRATRSLPVFVRCFTAHRSPAVGFRV